MISVFYNCIGKCRSYIITGEDREMNENVKVVFGLIGGLALFLYGMNSMSDALQKAAGERMKKSLDFLQEIQLWEHLPEHL